MGTLDSILAYKQAKEAQESSDIQAIPSALIAFTSARQAAHKSLIDDLTVKIAGAKQGLAVDTERGMITPDATLQANQGGNILQVGNDGEVTVVGQYGKRDKVLKQSPPAGGGDLTKLKLTGDETLSGEDYINSIQNKAYQNVLRNALDGKIDPRKDTSLRGINRAQLEADLIQADPSYDPSEPQVRQKVYQAFTSGPESRSMRSANLLIQHTGTLSDAMKQLDPGQFPSVNAWNNWIKSEAGKGAITAVKTALEPVATEAATLFKGQGNSSQIADSAITRFEDTINKGNLSPEQFQSFRNTLMSLVASRVGGLADSISKSPGSRIPVSVFNPEAIERLKEFGIDPAKFSGYKADETETGKVSKTDFNSIEEAKSANLPDGTKITIKGVKGTWRKDK